MEEKFEIYQNDNGEFRGRLIRANGETVTDPREHSEIRDNEIDASGTALAQPNNEK